MIKDKYLQKIGNLIAENRQKQGLTQTQLAEAIGTSQSAINRIENGGQNISIEMIARISEVLNNNIVTVNPAEPPGTGAFFMRICYLRFPK